jgi:elongation factor Tu
VALGDSRTGVPELLRDVLKRHTARHEPRPVGVAEILRPDVTDSRALQDPAPVAAVEAGAVKALDHQTFLARLPALPAKGKESHAKPGSITPHRKFRSQIYVLDNDDGGGRNTPFFKGYRPQFYFRTTDVTGTIDLAFPTQIVFPGEHATMEVELDEAAVIEPGLRFTIGLPQRAIGIGVVSETLD